MVLVIDAAQGRTVNCTVRVASTGVSPGAAHWTFPDPFGVGNEQLKPGLAPSNETKRVLAGIVSVICKLFAWFGPWFVDDRT